MHVLAPSSHVQLWHLLLLAPAVVPRLGNEQGSGSAPAAAPPPPAASACGGVITVVAGERAMPISGPHPACRERTAASSRFAGGGSGASGRNRGGRQGTG